MELLNGNIRKALYINPVGLLILFAIFLYCVCWLLDRMCATRFVALVFTGPFEKLRSHRKLYALTIVACLAVAVLNAYWNYCKGL